MHRAIRHTKTLFAFTLFCSFLSSLVYAVGFKILDLFCFPAGTRTVGRLRTAESRKSVARHCAFPVLRDIFFVILPSSVFQPSCCVRSPISNQIRFWFLISGEVPHIRWTWLDFVDLGARITWPCLRIRWMKLTFVTRILHHLASQEFRTEQRAFNTVQLIPMKWRQLTTISRLKDGAYWLKIFFPRCVIMQEM